MSNRARFLVALAPVAALAAGCRTEGPGVDVTRDDSIPRSEWTTPSEAGVRAANRPAHIRQREWPEATAHIEPSGVPHWPLWWEDPFEDKGDGNDTFCWTLADAVGLPYGMARFGLNTAGWPISAVVTPVWTPMVSDGGLSKQALGYDHDAVPTKSWRVSVPTRPPTTQPAAE